MSLSAIKNYLPAWMTPEQQAGDDQGQKAESAKRARISGRALNVRGSESCTRR